MATTVSARRGRSARPRKQGGFRRQVDRFLENVDETGSAAGDEVGVASAVALVKALDRRVQAATGHRFRLRFLVPATFVGLGVRALIVDGLTVGTLPWFVLIYFGVDSFLKLYPEHAPSIERTASHAPGESRHK